MRNGNGFLSARDLSRLVWHRIYDMQTYGPNASSMVKRYNSSLKLTELDKKWRLRWKKAERNLARGTEFWSVQQEKTQVGSKNMYILPMFPYPSGDLHLGHLRVYTISDVLARFYRMQGRKVIHPIGWDAFGLPAENAALERGIDPKLWTKQNIERMRSQLENMNGHWDWDREFATCDPSFYKHTQKLFILLHRAGLAYQAESVVNYDPVDKTVLANEQVDANGNSWRSGAKVERRMLKQWFLRISKFRQELLNDLKLLDKDRAWPERVLAMQRNWLGKSTGARIQFSVVACDQETHADIEVFTTRPDTLFGVQYLALAATHPMVKCLAKNDVELQAFLTAVPALPADSKVGYLLPNIRAKNPLAHEVSTPDATKASIPVFVAPYVLGDYGHGAVMGVPGHDTQDYSFWKHNRSDDPVRFVVAPTVVDSSTSIKTKPFLYPGYLTSHSGPFANMTTAEATTKILELLQSKGRGCPSETWKLRDWLISRQRYWGTPIPIIHCNSCGPVPVPDENLPVQLPAVDAHWGLGKSGNPLEYAHDWINAKCPNCGSDAKRETDTMDTFMDSSWYFMRFCDPQNSTEMFSQQAADASLPVDIYVGGVEHAILHLLYARFISKFIASTTLWPSGPRASGEPFRRLLAQGMVHGKTYSDPKTGRFLKPNEVDFENPNRPIIITTKDYARVTFGKMSKSKYNGVDPSRCSEKYGTDAIRAHILFQAPISEVLEWDEEKITGVTRWLRRVYENICQGSDQWRKINQQAEEFRIFTPDMDWRYPKETKLWRTVQGTINSVTGSYSKTHSLNTVVSDLMTLTNYILEFVRSVDYNDRTRYILHASWKELIKMMAPITPAFAEECWEILQVCAIPICADGVRYPLAGDLVWDSVFCQPFPTPDGTYELLAPRTQSCAVQINGKLRLVTEISVAPNSLQGHELEKWITDAILATEAGQKQFGGEIGEGKEPVMSQLHKQVYAAQSRSETAMNVKTQHTDITKARKVIVVKGGRTVNFVI